MKTFHIYLDYFGTMINLILFRLNKSIIVFSKKSRTMYVRQSTLLFPPRNVYKLIKQTYFVYYYVFKEVPYGVCSSICVVISDLKRVQIN